MSGLVYFKFRSQLSFDTVVFDGHFITIGELKRLIALKKAMGPDAVAELVISEPKTSADYSDDNQQIAKSSSVIIRRAPQARSRALLGATPLPLLQGSNMPATQAPASRQTTTAQPTHAPVAPIAAAEAAFSDDTFGADPISAAHQQTLEQVKLASVAAAQSHQQDVASHARGGRTGGGRGRGSRAPPKDYRCPRCNAVGTHYVNDCPTQGDSNYDVKRVRPPAGIPVTKLQRNPDGSLVLPTGEFGELMPNQEAFAKLAAVMSGAPSTAPASNAATAPHQPDVQGQEQQQQQVQTAPATRQMDQTAQAPAEQPPAQQIKPETPASQTTGAKPDPDASKPSALFEDDDDINMSLQPIKLTLSADMNGRRPSAASSGRARSGSPGAEGFGGSQKGEQSSAGDLGHATLTADEFFEQLPLLLEVLPKARPKLLYQAFGGARPLSRSAFEQLKAEHRTKEGHRHKRGRSRSRSPHRSRSKERKPRKAESPVARPSRRHHSHSREGSKQRDGSKDAVRHRLRPEDHSYRHRGDATHTTQFAPSRGMKPSGGVAQDQQEPAAQVPETSHDSYDQPKGRRSRLLEESSRIVDRMDGIVGSDPDRRARAGSAEASTGRADARSRSPQPDGVVDDYDDPRGSPASHQYSSDGPSGPEEGHDAQGDRGGEGKKHKKKHKKHKKHKDKDPDHRRSKKERRSKHKSRDAEGESSDDDRWKEQQPAAPYHSTDQAGPEQHMDDHANTAQYVNNNLDVPAAPEVHEKRQRPSRDGAGTGRFFQRQLQGSLDLGEGRKRKPAERQAPGKGTGGPESERWGHDMFFQHEQQDGGKKRFMGD